MFNFSFPSGNTKVPWGVLCFFMRIVWGEIMLSDLRVSVCLSWALHLKRIQWQTLVRVSIIVTLENLKKFLIIFFFSQTLILCTAFNMLVILWNLLGHSCVMDGPLDALNYFFHHLYFVGQNQMHTHMCVICHFPHPL